MTHLIISLAMFFLVSFIVLRCLEGLAMSISSVTIKIYQKHKPAGLENRRGRNLYKLEGQ
jgi:hypothetical protein